jgi:putative thiamine transport system permease protein
MEILARFGPPLAIFILTVPILFGLAGTVLPAFGFLPVLGGTELTTAHFGELAARPGIAISAAISVAAGLVSAAVSLGVVFVFVAAYAGTPVFVRVQHLVSPFLAVPHAAAAFGLAFLIAPSGMIARLISPWLTGWTTPPDLLIVHDTMGLTMMAGLIAKEIPFLLLMTLAALPQARLAENRALAASLGYGRIAGFAHTVWPNVYPQIRLAVFAVIAFSSSVVDVAVILGPTTPAPLAVRLVEWMGDPDLSSRHVASAGALLQLFVTLAALLAWLVLERIGSAARRAAATTGRRFRRDRGLAMSGLVAISVAAATIAAGLAILALWSVAGLWQFPDALPEEVTAQGWMRSWPRIGQPLVTTIVVALSSTALATLLVILCLVREERSGGRAGRYAWLIYLPLLVPQAAFLFGLQYLFVLIGIGGGLPSLVFVHLVFVLPYVFLSLGDPWRAFDRRYETIAAGLGRPRLVALVAIRLPILLRAILTAAAVGLAVSVGLYLPTLLIGAGRLDTITTEAVALASGGNRRVIGVYAFLQMLLPALGFWVATAVPALVFRSRRAMRV